MWDATGRQTYDISEQNGKYIPIQTNPEDNAIQIHTDGEIPGENTETIIQRSNRNVNKPNRYGAYHIQETSGAKNMNNKVKKIDVCYRNDVEPT